MKEFSEIISSMEKPIQFASRNKFLRLNLIKDLGKTLVNLADRALKLPKRKGIETAEDALYFLPRKYEDRRKMKKISALEVGKVETFLGEIINVQLIPYGRRRRKIFEMVLSDGSGVITAKWFHFSERYIKGRFKKGKKAILSGEIKAYRLRKEIHHPEIEIVDHLREDDLGFGRIVPIYSETEGLHQKTLRKIMKNVVDSYAHLSFSGIPQKICQRLSLISLSDAVRKVHFPDDNDDIDQLNTGQSPAHRRLIFDEFFFLQLGLALKKKGVILARGIPFKIIYNYVNQLLKLLSFDLTRAQKRVISQIEEDMARPCPMNRLIQGDVGSGKTIVALIASLIARENGYQTAIMALTELLAEQHYLNIHYLTDQLKVRTELLTGRIKGTAREDLYRETRDGRVDITIGTHAIIEEAVEFKRLGLVIIDEQHRFGVIQRGRLRRKGANPDVLVMSKGSLKKGIKFFKARKIIESSLQLS